MSIITNNFHFWKQPVLPVKICGDFSTIGTGEPTQIEKYAKGFQVKKTYKSSKEVTIPAGAYYVSLRPHGYANNEPSSFKIDDTVHVLGDENNGEVKIDRTTCKQEFVPAKQISEVVGIYMITLAYPKSAGVTDAQLDTLFK